MEAGNEGERSPVEKEKENAAGGFGDEAASGKGGEADHGKPGGDKAASDNGGEADSGNWDRDEAPSGKGGKADDGKQGGKTAHGKGGGAGTGKRNELEGNGMNKRKMPCGWTQGRPKEMQHKRLRKLEDAEEQKKKEVARLQNAAIFLGFHTFFANELRYNQRSRSMRKVCDEAKFQTQIVQICCPLCNEQTRSSKCKRWSMHSFSNLRCKECTVVTSTREWRCECGLLWYKCPMHFMAFGNRPRVPKAKINMRVMRRRLMIQKFGTSKPKPHRKFPRATYTREGASHVYVHEGSGRNMTQQYSEGADLRVPLGCVVTNRHAPPLHCA